MKTKWDCLFYLFELKQASLSAIAKKTQISSSSAWQKLNSLQDVNLVIQKDQLYLPNKENANTWHIFNIMKFCKNKGINYNLFLAIEFAKVIQICMSKNEVELLDFNNIDLKTVRKYLSYLSRVNLLFVLSKKPLRVKLLSDSVFNDVLSLHNLSINNKTNNETSHAVAAPTESYVEIEKLLTQFKTISRNIDFSNLDEERKIEFTSASTQLEGNTFTLEQSKDLILNDIVPQDKKLNEANEVKNYYQAVNYLTSNLDQVMSLDLILELHKITTYNLGVKQGVRFSNVSIHGNPLYKIALFHEILPKLNTLCDKINSFLKEKHNVKEVIEFATFTHNEFQHIHPFEDGNSLVTRLLWNYILMKNNFPLINIYSNTRTEYLSLTKLSRQRNDAKLNQFLIQTIKDNLHKITRVN